MKNSILDAALILAAQGIPSFPCDHNKRPTCLKGFQAATGNAAGLRQLWGQYGGALVGVPTGEVSGFDVLDIDPRHGGDKWLADNADKLPVTRIHQTRSHGQHFLFKHRPGLRNSAGKIAPGVDVRADGGYIIWWPASGLPVLKDAPPAPWPEWVLQRLLPPAPEKFTLPENIRGGAYASSALRRAAQNVASSQEGTRNHALNKELWSVLRFVSSGDLGMEEITRILASAALSAGLPKGEVVSTIASAIRARGL